MAGPGVSSPGGFSYAQAAKGRVSTSTSQAPSSKVTSGAATPATGLLSEFETASPSNWADDVDFTTPDKQSQSNEETQEKSKPTESKSVVERAKAEDKAQTSSGVSSPNPAASATSNDDASSANNASSQTSWDGKSQGSETPQTTEAAASGSWITARAERAERQSDSRHKHESSGKSKKHKAEKTEEPPAPPPKPVVLTEAPAPTVNPWAKLAEAQKAKQAAAPQPAARPAQAPGAATNLKENQRPRADSKKKTNAPQTNEASTNGDVKKSNPAQNKRSDEQRTSSRQTPKPAAGAQRADVNVPGYSRPAARDERPNTAAPPPVKDEVSWPTPDTAPVPEPKERKPVPEKDNDEKTDDSAPSGKSRKKQEWKPVPVVPNILWETPVMREKSARGTVAGIEGRGRGGASVRGRGSFRGAVNGVTTRAGAQGDETRQGRPESSEETATKSQRSASASSQSRNASKLASQQSKDSAPADVKPLPQRSAKSKAETTGLEGQETELAPEFIPRGPRADDIENTQSREGQAARSAMLEKPAGREGNWNGSGRGAKRGGRGRGGSREFGNGHHGSAHPFANGSAGPDFSGVSPFGVPQSPSFQPPRGNHQGNFAGPGRAGWRGNSRAQSFPVENSYGRYPSFPAPMQPYGHGMFEYGGYPVSAMPYMPMQDPNYLFGVVTLQLEYYFSLDNLLKDMYLRKNMDSQGFVYLEVITSFNRVKNLTQDWELIKQVCLQSDLIEIRIGEDGKERVRKIHDYQQFVLPMEDRFPAARHEGPTKLDIPEQRIPAMYHMGAHGIPHPMHMSRGGDRRDNAHAMMNGAARGAFFSHNGESGYDEEVRGRAPKPPVFDNGVHQAYMSNGNAETDPDVFPEHKLEQLTVCVRVSGRRVPYHTATARTFSNGSIDQRSIAGDISKQNGTSQSVVNGEAVTNGTSSPTQSRGTSPSAPSSPERPTGDHVFWIKDTEHPVGTLPSDLTPEPYVQLRLKAFEQRSHAATGNCPYDLKVLYQFWSHFLIRNFNNRMYSEFKYYADADSKDRASFEGQKNLIKYYGEAVNSANPLPTRVVNDYVELIKAEGVKTESPLSKSLKSAWLNKALNLRNRKKLADILDATLKAQLEA